METKLSLPAIRFQAIESREASLSADPGKVYPHSSSSYGFITWDISVRLWWRLRFCITGFVKFNRHVLTGDGLTWISRLKHPHRHRKLNGGNASERRHPEISVMLLQFSPTGSSPQCAVRDGDRR
ncbi:hypothetical protein, partial [Rhizobium sp. PDO1-076]|uniref:hypothetical protein n=1 Tax=Rhizobium sp. PDO1-076 TaxID=1125979 RepID=UPI001FCADD9D